MGLDVLFGALSFFFAIFLMMLIIALAITTIMIIAMWRILSKAGEPGWGALIPIYGQYLLCKIIGVNPWWLLIIICSPMLNIVPLLGTLASAAVVIYFLVLFSVSLARSFGKEDGFAVGLVLVPPIFYLMLAFGSAKYVGPKPMDDIIFNKINGNTNNNNTSGDSKFCTNCGAKLTQDTNFCPYCGKDNK